MARKTLAELEHLYSGITDATIEKVDRRGILSFLSGRPNRLVLQLATIGGPVAVAWSASHQEAITIAAAMLYVTLAGAAIGVGVYFDRKYRGEKNAENSEEDSDNAIVA